MACIEPVDMPLKVASSIGMQMATASSNLQPPGCE